MRRVSTQKGPIAFISGNDAYFYARYKLNIVPSKPSFNTLRWEFFPKKGSRESYWGAREGFIILFFCSSTLTIQVLSPSK